MKRTNRSFKAFGPAILSEDGTIDRKKLGQIVFRLARAVEKPDRHRSPGGISAWKRICSTMPSAKESARHCGDRSCDSDRDGTLQSLRPSNPDGVQRSDADCARRWLVTGLAAEAVKARIDKQLPLEEKKKYADYVIDTDGTKEETVRQIEAVFRDLEKLARVQ